MATSPENTSMALFCDFENVALGVRDAKYERFDIKRVLERLLLKGSIVVKKAYCDWDRYKAFKATMHEANFELIEIPHVRQSGKNSADIRLVVDALDLCYTKSHVNTFVIISGDSDFSPLVSKLRENAKQVIGVGVKQSTSDLLIANCDEFIFYDDLVRESQRAKRAAAPDAPQPATKRPSEEENRRRAELEARKRKAFDMVVETFEALLAERGDGGRIWPSMVKQAIKRRRPDFSESYFGFKTFGGLLEEAQGRGLLELGRDEKGNVHLMRATSAQALRLAAADAALARISDEPAAAAPDGEAPGAGDAAPDEDGAPRDEGAPSDESPPAGDGADEPADDVPADAPAAPVEAAAAKRPRGRGSEDRAAEARGSAGRREETRGPEGRGTQGHRAQGRAPDGRGAPARAPEERTSERGGSAHRGAEGQGSDRPGSDARGAARRAADGRRSEGRGPEAGERGDARPPRPPAARVAAPAGEIPPRPAADEAPARGPFPPPEASRGAAAEPSAAAALPTAAAAGAQAIAAAPDAAAAPAPAKRARKSAAGTSAARPRRPAAKKAAPSAGSGQGESSTE